jgi:hypothetical protein
MDKDIFTKMAEKWPSALVARTEIGKFTGGLISPGTLKNLDSLGKGPKTRVFAGKKVAYELDGLVEWLRKHCKVKTS